MKNKVVYFLGHGVVIHNVVNQYTLLLWC